ncbi:MAG: alpha/beta fold hydrolase [Candidatus Obscuribacterales bacterium]|nr:alpha/beta fold hydrolase [Candidatus Obscuribacterales bacterium]
MKLDRISLLVCMLLFCLTSLLPVDSRGKVVFDSDTADDVVSSVPNRQYRRANQLFFKEKYEEARVVVDKIISKLSHGPEAQAPRPRMNLAILQIIGGDHKTAYRNLKRVDNRLTNSGTATPRLKADLEALLAECEYEDGKVDKALFRYEKALSIYQSEFGAFSSANIVCLEGLAGCLYRKKEYSRAIDVLSRLANIDKTLYGQSSERLALTLRILSRCYIDSGKKEIAEAINRYSVASARRGDYDTLLADCRKKLDNGTIDKVCFDAAESRLRTIVIGRSDVDAARAKLENLLPGLFHEKIGRPPHRLHDFSNWTMPIYAEHRKMTPISIDPTQPLKTFIICIHGFGLSGDAYADFARRMSARGHVVVGMDMCGFGDFSFKKGVDTIDTAVWLQQVEGLVDEVGRDNSYLPLVLLGESMGGAIALQSAVLCQKKINGLICSVPGGERYGAVGEKMKVASNLVKSRWKPFDIGSKLVRHLFPDNENRDLADLDNARSMVSAAELLHFQKFMHHTVKAARKLDRVPSIFLQGLSDRLVKPKGTAEIYSAVKCRDKDFIVIGKQEHLVFEEGECPDWIIDCLDGWLKAKVLSQRLPAR